jgi:predicted anti-sigma-YlaC factor YlaD
MQIFAAAVLLTLTLAACSIERMAVDRIGNALAAGGSVYASDDDPDFVREAIPFGLKTCESLLAVSPDHRGLLLAAASGYTAYAYILQDSADRVAANDPARARAARARASRLYLRGRDYALRGLEVAHSGFKSALRRDRAAALATTDGDDIAFLYWAGAAWAGALSAAKDNLDLIAELPLAAALVERVLVLDESFDRGAAHDFFISYEGGRPGGSAGAARQHYRQALALSGGLRASAHLALAEAVAVGAQDVAEFRVLLAAARAVDPDRAPELRLANVLAGRRAEWLVTRIPELFIESNDAEATQ